MKFFQKWFWSGVAESSSRAGSLLLFVIYFPLLGKTAAGTVLAGYAYVMSAWLFIDLGLGFYGVRAIAERQRPAQMIQAEITFARMIMASVLTPIVTAFLVISLNVPLLIAMGFAIYLYLRSMAGDWRLRGEARFRTMAIVNMTATSLQVLCLLFIRSDNWKITATLPWLVWGVAFCAGTWLVTGMSVKQLLSENVRNALSQIRHSFAFSLSNGASVLFSQLPIIVLSLSFAPAKYADFALLHRLIISANLVFQTMGAAIFPKVVRAARIAYSEAWDVNKQVIVPTVVAAMIMIVVILGAYCIGQQKYGYFSSLSWVAIVSMCIFLALRGFRENVMRMMLALRSERLAAIVISTVVFSFALWVFSLKLLDWVNIDAVAASFALFEGFILISFVLCLWLIVKVRIKGKVVHG